MLGEIELVTIRDFIRFAVSQFNKAQLFYGHGTTNAYEEALFLILHSLFLPYDIDINFLDAKLLAEEKKIIIEQINRRVEERIPAPYLTHEALFAGLSFYVDERVLVPRSSIGELIENQFEPWLNIEKVNYMLDLCTGSGCIAIACAKYFPHIEIDASDISKEALAVAKINILRHRVTAQINLIEANLFENLPPKKYDLIISNPPYVDELEMALLPKEYLHEPSLALKAGKEGLDFILTILKKAPLYLQKEGILIIETGNAELLLTEKYPHIPFTWIEFAKSEGGVFILTYDELIKAQDYL